MKTADPTEWISGAPPSCHKNNYNSQDALQLWKRFLSTWEGRDPDTNKCPRVWCRATLQDNRDMSGGFGGQLRDIWQTCGSNRKRSCWKTRLNYGSPRRITSISYCKGDEGTEKVEAGWQVTLAAMISPPPRMWRTTQPPKPHWNKQVFTGFNSLFFYVSVANVAVLSCLSACLPVLQGGCCCVACSSTVKCPHSNRFKPSVNISEPAGRRTAGFSHASLLKSERVGQCFGLFVSVKSWKKRRLHAGEVCPLHGAFNVPVVGLHVHDVCVCFILLCATVVCQIWTPVTSPDLDSCIWRTALVSLRVFAPLFSPRLEI